MLFQPMERLGHVDRRRFHGLEELVRGKKVME